MTRIFSVEFFVTEKTNGKEPNTSRDNRSVKAKDASHAIAVVSAKVMKATSYIDEKTKKKITVTVHDFDPVNVTLQAEAE